MVACIPELGFSVSEFAEAGLLEPSTLSLDEALEIETNLPSSLAFDSRPSLRETQPEINFPKASPEAADPAGHCTTRSALSTLLSMNESPQLIAAPDSLQPLEQRNPNADTHSKRQAAQNGRIREAVDRKNKKLAQNREHQRRFKIRQQAKAKAVEDQLAVTTAELQALKLRQQELESLLQHAREGANHNAQLPSQMVGEPAAQHSTVTVLTVSVHGKVQYLTHKDVCAMPVEAYSALWEDYMHVLEACLTKLASKFIVTVEDRLNQLTFEAVRLCTHRLQMTPEAHHMATNAPDAAAAEQQLPEADLAALCRLLDLSKDQTADLMRIRQVCLVKRHLIAAEHSAIMADMQSQCLNLDITAALPRDGSQEMAKLAERLEQNRTADAQVVHRVSRAMFCGVLTMKQAAQVVTYTYGFRPSLDAFLNAFAAELNYPSADKVITTASKADMDNKWTEFWQYTQLVDPDVSAMYQYVPLCRHKRAAHHTRVAVNQNI